MPSEGKTALKLAVVAALMYAIMIISNDSMELDLVRRRVLTADMDRTTREQKNRLVMNEFAKRSRVARLRSGIYRGPVFHATDFIQLMGADLVRAEDKPKILNDGTYLIFQNHPHIFFHDGYIKPNMCWNLIKSPDKIKRVHYHGGKCKDFDNQFGNRLGWVYGMKMIANGARIPFYFTCDISHGESPNGAAYLMTLNPRDSELGPVPKGIDGSDLTLEDVCRPCRNSFCGWNGDSTYMASDAMVQDWEQLAASTMKPVDNNDDIDDAVIHLRLGDAMYARSGISEDKGLFPHGTYIRLLKQAQEEKGVINSIGIVTAPFKGEFVRAKYDSGSTSTSALIAEDLVNALQEAFPQAKISIHNSPDETIIGALTRIVNARKVAVCGCSTFCPYPLLATKGIGYMFGPASTRHRQNDWIYNAAKRYDDFRLFETPMLNGLVIDNWATGEKLNFEDVREWLKAQDSNAGNIDIMDRPILRNA